MVRSHAMKKIDESCSPKEAQSLKNKSLTFERLCKNPLLFSTVFKNVTVVPVKDKIPFTLAVYFRMIGVCKDWEKHQAR
jgi:hypothetical protein